MIRAIPTLRRHKSWGLVSSPFRVAMSTKVALRLIEGLRGMCEAYMMAIESRRADRSGHSFASAPPYIGRMTRADPLPEIADAYSRGGVRAALAALNARAGTRFTALYHFKATSAHNLFFFDRQSPEIEDAGELSAIPVEVTYCTIVRDGGRPVRFADALAEAKLIGHPSRETVRAYCGVPLKDGDGLTFGTLCHFDFEPREVPEAELDLMERVAILLQPERFRS